MSVCLNWISAESWWRQRQGGTSEGEGENEILASIVWQHFSWLTGWGEANVSRGLRSALQICNCIFAELRIAVQQLLRSSVFWAPVCDVGTTYLPRASKSWLTSQVHCPFLQETCNQESIGIGKCICKLLHLIPEYSLNKHWKFSLSDRPGLDTNTQPICWAKQTFTPKSGVNMLRNIYFSSALYHRGHPRLPYICMGICCVRLVWEMKRERGQDWGSRWEISTEWWMSVIACPSIRLLHSPSAERNVFFTSLCAWLPE